MRLGVDARRSYGEYGGSWSPGGGVGVELARGALCDGLGGRLWCTPPFSIFGGALDMRPNGGGVAACGVVTIEGDEDERGQDKHGESKASR